MGTAEALALVCGALKAVCELETAKLNGMDQTTKEAYLKATNQPLIDTLNTLSDGITKLKALLPHPTS